jgi:Kdo2-lipid IVA lauroyltransferase/acyltransferase
MQALTYYLALPFIYLVSLLPFPLLYAVSDFFFVLLYHVLKYRRGVVISNLRNSFPGKNEEEIRRMERAFYRHLCDLFMETFKTLTISPSALARRCRVKDMEAVRQLHRDGRSIVFVMGHHGNWEWAGASYTQACPYPIQVIYRPLRNIYFDRLMIRLRSRFGAIPVPMHEIGRRMLSLRNTPTATVFIADQTPPPENACWTSFLNQDTPVFTGTEKLAKKFGYPVLFASVKKVKRGYYEIETETIVENPSLAEEGEITIAHTRRLETEIREQPETWLWSHRRWKHRRPAQS